MKEYHNKLYIFFKKIINPSDQTFTHYLLEKKEFQI